MEQIIAFLKLDHSAPFPLMEASWELDNEGIEDDEGIVGAADEDCAPAKRAILLNISNTSAHASETAEKGSVVEPGRTLERNA